VKLSRYGDNWGPWHGKQGGVLYERDCANRLIRSVRVYHDHKYLNALSFTFDDGSVFGPFGRSVGSSADAFFVRDPGSGFLSFVKGSSGDLVDRIELYVEGSFFLLVKVTRGPFLTSHLAPRGELHPYG
jgi:hypothetical protein